MRRYYKAILAGLLTGLLGLVLIPVTADLEQNIGLDLLFKLRGPKEAPTKVVIVSMDKDSSEALNLPEEPGKWPRSLHGRLIESLVRTNASVIVFDILFDEHSTTEQDRIFSQTMRSAGNVVLCECLKKDTAPLREGDGTQNGDFYIESVTPPIPIFAESALALAPFPLPKVPVKVSQYWVIKRGAGDIPTLPTVTLQAFALEVYNDFIRLLEKVSPGQAIHLPKDKDTVIASKGVEELIRSVRDIFQKDPQIADELLRELENTRSLALVPEKKQTLKALIKMYQGETSRYLNFYGPPGTIPTISYHSLLPPEEKSGEVCVLFNFTGKVVFVGLSETLRPEQKDGFHTVYSQASGIDISGVEIAATAFANLLEDKPVHPISLPLHMIGIFLGGVLLGFICSSHRPQFAATIVTGLGAIYVYGAHYHFDHAGIWYPLVVPLLFQVPMAFFGSVLWRYADTEKERRNMRKAFGLYLPEEMVDQSAKNLPNIKEGGEIRYGICLFTDAEKYTTLSENMLPKDLRDFMNKYYEAIFPSITKHGGFVSDVKGDGILAVWAPREPGPVPKQQACLASLDIIHSVDEFNASSEMFKLPTRIGSHSGYIFLGNVGAGNHYEYRPVGDIVNTASRLENLNKYMGTRILVSDEMVEHLNGFLARKLGKFLLSGKTKPIVVSELISHSDDATEYQRSLCAVFDKALAAYRSRSWVEAMDIFYRAINIYGADGPSSFYLKECERYMKNPPGDRWDGVVRLDKK